MSSNYDKLIKFMEKYRIQKDDLNKKYTHISMGKDGYLIGKFCIPDEKIESFFGYYNKAIKDNCPLFIGEIPIEQGPITIDIDIKYELNNDSSSRIYEEQDINNIVEIYNNIIKIFQKVDDDDFKAYILEKKKPSIVEKKENDNKIVYKDGIHIIYPMICATNNLQLLIREYAIDELKKNKTLEHLTLINDYDDIVDKNVIGKNAWLLYGSGKSLSDESIYKLTKIINANGENDSESNELNGIVQKLSIRKFKSASITEYIDGLTEDKVIEMYNKILLEKKKLNKNKKNEVSINELQKCKKLVRLLNPNRADKYTSWRDVGLCLHNIDNNLLEDWIEFSKQWSGFKEGECEKIWKTYKEKKDGLGIGSLHKWAREDNPEKYSDFLLSEYDDIVYDSLTGTSGKVAKLFYTLYKYNYICEDAKSKSIYEFINHKWKYLNGCTTIINKLNEEFSMMYLKLSSALAIRIPLEQDKSERDKLITKQKCATSIALKLGKMAFKKEILEELYIMFSDDSFRDKLDENKNLICFTNGVLDLTTMELRDGRPDDYISLCTNTEYIKYDLNNIYIKQVEEFFTDILPEDDIRDYLLRLLSSSLAGYTKDQLFPIWTGKGANGKGRTMKLALDSFGDYATTLNVCFLTEKRRNSSAANPELAKTKGKRLCIFQEPEPTDEICSGNMKSLVGGDKLEARKLHQNPFEFYPQFKCFLACNQLPYIKASDGGTWRRIRVIPFNMQFLDNPNPNISSQKMIKKNLDEEIDLWKPAFMSILVEKYKSYKTQGLIEPQAVMVQTKNYKSDSDVITEYANEKIRITQDDNDIVKLNDLYKDFKNWLKNDKMSNNKIERQTFKNEIDEKITKCIGNIFYGIRIRSIHDDFTETENKLNSSIRTNEANNFEKNNNFKKNNLSQITTNEEDELNNLINMSINSQSLSPHDNVFIKSKSKKNKKSSLDVVDI